jgi:hypothetical protein
MVGDTGLETVTFPIVIGTLYSKLTFSQWYYGEYMIMVGDTGLEPVTSCV